MKKIEGLKIEPVGITQARDIPMSIAAMVNAGGYIDGPASQVDAHASYTFEVEIDGRWYRWTGQRPLIVGDRARFWLRDGTLIAAPA